MALFDEMLAGLCDARLIASPYEKAEDDRDPARRKLAMHFDALIAAARKGDRCPSCGEAENVQDNGEKGDDRTWRCEECGDQWDRHFGRED